MRLKYLTPMLWTGDLKATVEFYRSVLGFELDQFDKNRGWCHLHRDSVNLMFCLPSEHEPFEEPHATATFYLYVEEIDELWEQLKDKAKIFYPIDNFEYNMREFAIKDNNGYVLQFGRELREGETISEETE